jgi:hypothetical protein
MGKNFISQKFEFITLFLRRNERSSNYFNFDLNLFFSLFFSFPETTKENYLQSAKNEVSTLLFKAFDTHKIISLVKKNRKFKLKLETTDVNKIIFQWSQFLYQ